MKKTGAWIYVSVVIPSISFLLLTVLAPKTEVLQFGMSPEQLLFARLVAGTVFVITWLTGAACIIALSRIISEAEEPRRSGLRRFSAGILLLIIGMMLATNVTTIRTFFLDDPVVSAALTVLYNYLFILPQLAAFLCIFSASGSLQDPKARPPGALWITVARVSFVLFAAIYVGLIFTNAARTAPAGPGQLADYYLPDSLIVVTVILPFLTGIALAIASAFRFARQSLTFAGGSRSSADRLIHAVIVIVMSSIFLQGLFILGSNRLAALGPAASSALVFAFLFTLMAGFIMLLRAVKKVGRFASASIAHDVSPARTQATALKRTPQAPHAPQRRHSPQVKLPPEKAWPYAVILALAGSYLALTFLAPRSGVVLQFGLTPYQLFLVRLSAVVAYLVSWLAGTHAVVTLFAIAGTSEPGKRSAFRLLGAGFLCLMSGLVVAVHVSALRSIYIGDQGLAELFTIILNYCFVFPPLAGFALIFLGSGRLRVKGAVPRAPLWTQVLAALALMTLGAGYVWLVFTGPSRQVPATASGLAIYYLSDPVIAVSIVAPVLVGFVLATGSLFRISRYYVNLGGIYRFSADRIIASILMIQLASLFLQSFYTLGSARLSSIGIIFTLVIIEADLLAMMFGYLMLARAIRRIAAAEANAESFMASQAVTNTWSYPLGSGFFK